MVTASLATPSCKYAILTYRDDRSFLYRTQSLDVEAWAKKNQCTEEDLLNFKQFQTPFLRRVFYNQAIASLNDPAYELWQEDGMATQQGEYFRYILEDGKRDYNRLEVN